MDNDVESAVFWLRDLARRVSEWTLSSESLPSLKRKLIIDNLLIRRSLMQRTSKRKLIKQISKDQKIHGNLNTPNLNGSPLIASSRPNSFSRAMDFKNSSMANLEFESNPFFEFKEDVLYVSKVHIGNQYQAQIPNLQIDAIKTPRGASQVSTKPEPPAGELILKPSDSGSQTSKLDRYFYECECESKGSMDCVRLHVIGADEYLKRKLGPAYYAFGFQFMGEKYAVSWSRKAEREFVTIADQYPRSRGYNFWNYLAEDAENKPVECLRNKPVEDFVNYYFNVFTLRRRAAQNRLDLDANSDDDETRLFDVGSDEEDEDEDEEVEEEKEVSDGGRMTNGTARVFDLNLPVNGISHGDDDGGGNGNHADGVVRARKRRKLNSNDSVVFVVDSSEDEEGNKEEKSDGESIDDDDVDDDEMTNKVENGGGEGSGEKDFNGNAGTGESEMDDDVDDDVDDDAFIVRDDENDVCIIKDDEKDINDRKNDHNIDENDDNTLKLIDRNSCLKATMSDDNDDHGRDTNKFLMHYDNNRSDFYASKDDAKGEYSENKCHSNEYPDNAILEIYGSNLNCGSGIFFPPSNLLDDLLGVVDLNEFE